MLCVSICVCFYIDVVFLCSRHSFCYIMCICVCVCRSMVILCSYTYVCIYINVVFPFHCTSLIIIFLYYALKHASSYLFLLWSVLLIIYAYIIFLHIFDVSPHSSMTQVYAVLILYLHMLPAYILFIVQSNCQASIHFLPIYPINLFGYNHHHLKSVGTDNHIRICQATYLELQIYTHIVHKRHCVSIETICCYCD